MQRNSLSIGILALAAVCGIARADEGRTSFLHFGELDREVAGRAQQCEFEFTLWDGPQGGERIGKTLIYDGWEANKARVPVKGGYFEVVLDFGVEIHDDKPVYVESRYACVRGAKWTTVGRVAVTEDLLVEDDPLEEIEDPTGRRKPSRRLRPIRIDEPDDSGESAGTFNNTLEAADGDPSPAVVVDADGNTSMVGDLTIGGAIKIDGDNNPLEIHVNGVRALRFEYADAFSEAPNVIGGSPNNSVVAQKAGAVIAGGGSTTGPNQVSEDWGTVSGGRTNHAFGMFGTVSGGSGNTATGDVSTVSGGQDGDAVGLQSTVGGGLSNAANGNRSTVAGGNTNTAGGLNSSIGGGQANSAGGTSATVPGGLSNSAAGDYSFAAGRRAKANNAGSFVWADSTNANFTSTADNQFLIRAAGGVGIGTTAPDTALHTATSEDYGGITIQTKDNALNQGLRFRNSGTSFTWMIHRAGGIGTPADLVFRGGNANVDPAGLTERMRIKSNGNVGIGTDAPTDPLDVEGDVRINDSDLRLRGGSDVNHGLGWYGSAKPFDTTAVDGPVLYGFQGGALGSTLGGQKIALSWKDTGRVGIGTTNPQAELDVNGAIHIKGVKPFVFRTYELGTCNSACSLDTEFSATDYICSIAGFKATGGDIQENGTVDPILMRMVTNSGGWRIRADFASHNNGEEWKVDVWCVRRELADFGGRP